MGDLQAAPETTKAQRRAAKNARGKATWKQRQYLHWQLDLKPADTESLRLGEASELIAIIKGEKSVDSP